MATTNRPDRISCDAFSDVNLFNIANNGNYSDFSNTLTRPLLNVKAVQLLRANFVNSSLQLNDYNGQLFFVYSRNTTTAIPADGSTFHVVRLHPSWFVPNASFTAFVKNKYYNNGAELVADLNLAAATGGDSTLYNPSWLAGDVTFSFNTSTRKISFAGTVNNLYYAPIPYDHPALPGFLINAVHQVKMNGANNGAGGAGTGTLQPYARGLLDGTTMNQRLGFAMGYGNRGIFWGSSSVIGCATTAGVPQLGLVSIEGDSWPILIGTQNVNVYANIVAGSGQDSRTLRTLLATIPIENAPLGVCSYTLTSVDGPALSVGNEIYNISFSFLDDCGTPFYFSGNYNTNLELNIFYH
jgi:hypothetical protein